MSIKTRWNTKDDYTVEDIINEQKTIIGNNLCFKDSFKAYATPVPSMNINITQGNAKLKGVSVYTDSQETVTILTNSSSYSRYDIIALTLNTTTFEVSLEVVQGVASSSPAYPDLNVNQMALAIVLVTGGASSILDSNITDARNILNYDSLAEAVTEIVKTNKEKTFITSKSSNIDVSNYSAEHNWYYVRNGFCTLSLDLLIKFWTGNTSGISDSYILSGLPKPVAEIHYGLTNFDNKNRASLSVVVDADGSIRIINVHSYNGSTRFSGTITYPIALAD